MKKIVSLIRCVCEECDKTVNSYDKYCSKCGNKLSREEPIYEILDEVLHR